MKTPALLAVPLALVCACTPDVKKEPPPTTAHARFDPSTSPPTVPSPNSLAINPATGKVEVPLGANASEADRQFAAYLGTLDGFPADTPAQATFDAALQPESITPQAVQVLDITTPTTPVPVTNAPPSIMGTPPPGAASAIQLEPPGGWTAGHSYAVVILGGANGLKGADGNPVVGSSVWAFTRSQTPLVTCTDLTSADCRSTTALLTNAQAVRLEPLRRSFQPLLDQLAASGVSRNDVALAWTFKIASATVMAFEPNASPPMVPTPTDLAIDPATGNLAIPIDPSTSPANQAFVRDYLNTLNGYPTSTAGAAPVAGGTLDPSTVSASTVRILDLTPAADAGTTMPLPVDTTIAYSSSLNAITIAPPAKGWTKGHRYGVVVVGGPSGAKDSSGNPVGASSVWALARGTAPVATCADPQNAGCTSTLTVTQLSDMDAARLEQLRSGMAPLLDAFAAQGVPREAIPVAWTFRIFSNPELVFDPANSVLPFPNDLLRSAPTDGGVAHVELPVPDGGSAFEQQLITGLNTLDGFSTTAPIVSESSLTGGPLTDGAQIDPATVDGGTGFVKLSGSSNPNVVSTDPVVVACVDCASSLLADGGTQAANGAPQQLQFVPQVPLDEQSTYAAFVTTGLKDQTGTSVVANPTFALLRSPEPLVDGNGHSTIQGVSDAQAKQAEPARQQLAPMFSALESQGVARSTLALAWAFTTESTVSQLAQLRSINEAAKVPTTLVAFAPSTTAPSANESAIFEGELASAFTLTGPQGTINPSGAVPMMLPFVLAVPKAAPPGNGYPVAIFGHGFRGSRNDALKIADALASAGIATIAIDEVWHGERTTCTGSAAALQAAGVANATDDYACGGPGGMPNPLTQKCDEGTPIGRCVSRAGVGNPCTFLAPGAAAGTGGDLYCLSVNQGFCQPTGNGKPGASKCEGGDFWRTSAGAAPRISGWNIFQPANIFGTRDNFRQQVIDFDQVARVVKGTGKGSLNDALTSAGASGTLDGANIHYVGMSLGGIVGTLYTAVSPDAQHVVLSSPTGDLPRVLLTTQEPNLLALQQGFLQGLEAQGLPRGSPQFDQFIGFAKWILDPADPVNAGIYVSRGPYAPQAQRKALIQYIENDQSLSNPTTEELIAATIRSGQSTCAMGASSPCADVFEFTDAQFGSVMPPPAERHSFLLNGASPELTTDAQTQAVQYLTQGTVKTTFP